MTVILSSVDHKCSAPAGYGACAFAFIGRHGRGPGPLDSHPGRQHPGTPWNTLWARSCSLPLSRRPGQESGVWSLEVGGCTEGAKGARGDARAKGSVGYKGMKAMHARRPGF